MRTTKPLVKALVLLIVTAVCSGSNCMEHTRCDDTTISNHLSPDGKFNAVLYHRSCARGSGKYTGVMIEELTVGSTPVETGYVMSIRGFHPITARWKDATHFEVITPGLSKQTPDEMAAYPPKSSWKGITISYKPSD